MNLLLAYIPPRRRQLLPSLDISYERSWGARDDTGGVDSDIVIHWLLLDDQLEVVSMNDIVDWETTVFVWVFRNNRYES